MEELAKLLTPIIESSVKRHIENITSRISRENLSKRRSDFNSNQEDNEGMGLHTKCRPDYSKAVNSKNSSETRNRVKQGTRQLEHSFKDILASWGIDPNNSSSEEHNDAFTKMGCQPTTLQDYYIGKLSIQYL